MIIGQFHVDTEGQGSDNELAIDIEGLGSVFILVGKDDSITVSVFPLSVADEPVGEIKVLAKDLFDSDGETAR